MRGVRILRHSRGRLSTAVLATLATVAAGAGAVTAVNAAAGAPGNTAARQAQNCPAGYVALTYDDGPGGNTMNLLRALEQAGARATFFNIGNNVRGNMALAKAQLDAGHWVGNHSLTHGHMNGMSQQQQYSELQQTNQLIQQATGVAPKLFRPPYGETGPGLKGVAQQLGLTEIIWDVDSQDWNGASTQAIVQAASRLQNGGVILMHDTYQTTVQAVPQIVRDLQARGLCPGMISPETGRAVAPDDEVEPTPEPTEEPSAEPTASAEPTEEPTEEPTGEPTEEPTGEPTDEPTEEPTDPTEPTEPTEPEPTEPAVVAVR